MNERVARLRRKSFEAVPCVSAERAQLVTQFYKENIYKYSTPVSSSEICHKRLASSSL